MHGEVEVAMKVAVGDAARHQAFVVELLLERQQECHAQLVTDLRSLRRAQLGRDWAQFLAGDGPWPADDGGEPGSDAPDAWRPAIVVAATHIHGAHHRLVRDGRAIGEASPPEALHDLRKDAKRFRYLLECFGSLLPDRPRTKYVRQLKALQEILGEHQDAEVHIDLLRSLTLELDTAGVDADTLVAIGQLTERLDRTRRTARADVAERFADFDSPATRRSFHALIEAITP
jgi:CHAD domain-containing protein